MTQLGFSVIPATAYSTHPWRLRTANVDCPTLSINHVRPTFPNQRIIVRLVTSNPSAETIYIQAFRPHCAVLTTKHAHMPGINLRSTAHIQISPRYYEKCSRCECLHLKLHALSVPPRSANPKKTRTPDHYDKHQGQVSGE